MGKTQQQNLELDFATRRGMELQELKNLRLNDPFGRVLLLVLDLYINSKIGYWDMTHDDLIEATELSRSTYYDRLNKLRKMRLISCDDVAGTNRKRFRLIRSNINEQVRIQRLTGTKASSSESSKQVERQGSTVTKTSREVNDRVSESVHQPDSVREPDYLVRVPDKLVRELDESVREPDGTILPTQYRSTTAPLPNAMAAAVIVKLSDLGIEHPTPAVESALSRGSDPSDLITIVDHWECVHKTNGWGVGALQKRIANHSPGLPIESSWPKSKAVKARPAAVAIADIASETRLDQIEIQELETLIKASGNATLISMMVNLGVGAMRRSETSRQMLLKLIQSMECVK